MFIKKIVLAFLVLNGFSLSIYSQSNEIGRFELETWNNRKVTIPFKLINNLIVIPASINGSDTLHFVLDTGVSSTLITEFPFENEIEFNYSRTVKIGGLGEGESMDVLYSPQNTIEFGKAIGSKQDILVMEEDFFNLSTLLGTNVNGLIGYSLFKDFIVEIDYKMKRVVLHDHERYGKKYQEKKRSRKWSVIPLTMQKQKPYIEVNIDQQDGTESTVKLLLDSGASHAMALYYTSNKTLHLPAKKIRSFLGNGISGEINGYLGRINSVDIVGHSMDDVVVAYPDEEGIKKAVLYSERDGSIGADVLRRFKMFFNYRDKSMIVRPERSYNYDFSYNISGIEISTPYPGIPLYSVSHIREGSIAERVDIQKGDLLIEINGRGAQHYSLSDLNLLFQNSGKRIRFKVIRGTETLKKQFILKNELD